MKRFLPLLALGLAGCSYPTQPPPQMSGYLTRAMSGHAANEFFLEHGNPIGEVALNNGDHVYRWATPYPSSGENYNYAMNNYPPAGDDPSVDRFQGLATTHYCEIRVHTDAEDVIRDVAIAVDSMGDWNSSTCSQLLYHPFV